MSWARTPLLLAGALLTIAPLGACGDSDGETGTDSDGTTGDESEAGSDGATTEGGTAGESETGGETDGPPAGWSFDPVRANPNLDDDNGEARADWLETPFDGDDDLLALPLPLLPAGDQVRVALSGDVDVIRVWTADGKAPALGSGNPADALELTLASSGDPITLTLEFGDYNAVGALELEHVDAGGAVVESATVSLRSSPLIMNHHLLPAERLWVVDTQGCSGANTGFVGGYKDALGDRVVVVPGTSYGCDRWIQDEIEFSTSFDQDGLRLNTTIDSIRDRELDDLPEDIWFGPGDALGTWGAAGQETTFDSFGNLEASPPVTVDGVEYPYGRIYYGNQGGVGLHPGLQAFLASQSVQEPFEVDSTWLCVGHVDEWISFIPDASAPKGFRMLYADVDAGYALLEQLGAGTSLGRYGPDHGYSSVGAILGDAGLRAYNEDLRDDHLLPMRARMMTELGLSEEDVIDVPSLFEEVSGFCRSPGKALALIPGTVNLIVANFGEGDDHLFIPDPFLRGNGEGQGADALIEWFNNNMPPALQLHFIDDWYSYHLQRGEVHCGTNVRRTPEHTDWWEVAAHLLGGN